MERRVALMLTADAASGRHPLRLCHVDGGNLKDNARPEAGAVYGAIDMPWAKLVSQIAAEARSRPEVDLSCGRDFCVQGSSRWRPRELWGTI